MATGLDPRNEGSRHPSGAEAGAHGTAPRSRGSRLRLGLLLGALLLPALGANWQALAEALNAPWKGGGDDGAAAARKKILLALPTDPTVLINVTSREMPASPDILNLGKRSTEALQRCMADNAAADLRGLCAELLGVLGDRRSLPMLYTALEDWEAEVRLGVIKSLGKMPDERSIEPLLKAYRRRDEALDNRKAILSTLGQLSSRRAIKLLREELRKKPQNLANTAKDDEAEAADRGGLRAAAFAAVWHARRLIPRGQLEDDVAFALGSRDDALVYPAVLVAADLASPRLVRPLLMLLGSSNQNTLNKTVYALGRIGDRSATKPLMDLLPGVRDARLLNNIAFALERLDRAAFFAEIKRLVEHKQAIIRLNAAFVIGDVKRPEGRDLLGVALGDASERVKIEAISAIAKLPAQAPRATVDPLLARALSDPSDEVRLEAIRAVAKLDAAALDRAQVDPLLTKMLADKYLQVQREAMQVLATHGTAAAIAQIEPFTKHENAWLREEALYTVHSLSGNKEGPRIFDRLFSADSASTRRRAAIALGKLGDPRVRGYLLGCFEAKQCLGDDVAPFLRADKDPGTPPRVLLNWARDRIDLAPVVAALKPSGASLLVGASIDAALSQNRLKAAKDAIDLLGALGDAGRRPQLQALAGNADAWLRLHAKVALARLGEPTADASLMGEIDNLPGDWLPAVVRFVATLPDEAVRARLVPELARREASAEFPIALAAAAIRLEWRPEQALPRLLTALASERVLESDLAERYLRRAQHKSVTKLLSAALQSEKQDDTRVRLRKLIDSRGPG